MADIKVCDKCGTLFNPRGAWQVLHATSFVATEDGIQRTDHTDVELCSACMFDPAAAVSQPPQLPMPPKRPSEAAMEASDG